MLQLFVTISYGLIVVDLVLKQRVILGTRTQIVFAESIFADSSAQETGKTATINSPRQLTPLQYISTLPNTVRRLIVFNRNPNNSPYISNVRPIMCSVCT